MNQIKYKLKIGNVEKEVDVVPVSDDIGIAYLDFLCDKELIKETALELVKRLKGQEINYIVCPATGAIPLCYELSNLLKIPYVVLRKDKRKYMNKSYFVPVQSISSYEKEYLYIEDKYVKSLQNSNVLILDTVCSSGNTIKAMIDLMKQININISAKAVAFYEGEGNLPTELIDMVYIDTLPIFNNISK